MRNVMRYTTAGLEFFAIFGLFLLAGYLLDRQFATLPGFMLLGGAIGFGAALRRLIREAVEMRRQAERDDDRTGERGADG